MKIPLANLDLIDYLICKFNSSALIDSSNKMYFWGDYFDGFKIKQPELLYDFEDKLIDISFGFKHALVLLDNKSVLSWGDGTYGELGLGKAFMVPEPREISFFRENEIQIIKVEAGARHSICLDNLGRLFGFGVNTFES